MRKKLITAATVLAAAALIPALSAGAAHASPTSKDPSSGAAVADAPAARASHVVGGGIWDYGVGGGKVWSAYDNQRLVHSASVRSSGVTKSSGKVAKGKIAYASRPSALGGNQAFWNVY